MSAVALRHRRKRLFLHLLLGMSLPCVFFLLALNAVGEPLPVIFSDATLSAGLGASQHLETYSAAAADFNHDGYPDILISHHGSMIRLWENSKDGTFVDATSLIPFTYGDVHGVSFVDLNQDSFPDIALSCGAQRGRGNGGNQFFINQQGKGFLRWQNPPEVLLDVRGRSRSITPTDFNGDGRMDLFLFSFFQKDRPNRLALSTSAPPFFKEVAYETGIEGVHAFAMGSLYLRPGGNLYNIATGPDVDAGKVYENLAGTLVDVSAELGIDEHHAIAYVPFDYDNDGDMDLFFVHRGFDKQLGAAVSEDRILLLLPFRGSHRKFVVPVNGVGDLTFDLLFEGHRRPSLLHFGREKTVLETKIPTLAVSSEFLQGEPYVGSDDTGVFVWQDSHGQLHFVFRGSQKLQEVFGEISGTGVRGVVNLETPYPKLELQNNTLYRNDGGHFTEVSSAAGVTGNGYAMDALAADFNNDGYIDIYQVTAGNKFDATNPPNLLFMNNGDGTFNETAVAAGAAGTAKGSGNSAIALDYDRDGDMDLLLLNGWVKKPVKAGPVMLLRNDSKKIGKSISLSVPGRQGNTQGWGTVVLVASGKGTTMLQKMGYSGFLATSDLPLHLGTGIGSMEVEVELVLPDGKMKSYPWFP